MVRINDILHIFMFLIAIIPSLIYRKAHKPFWLVSECRNEARDNGYWFFKYVTSHHSEQPIVYAIDRKSPDYRKVNSIGKTVQYGSLSHWILYLACDIRISTHKAGTPNNAVCYVLEVYKIIRKKVVFLQHGVIKDDLPYVHARNANFSMFVTSARREYEYVREHFGYKKGVVVLTGLCRFDDLTDCSDGNLILIMPTWRQWIANPDSKNRNVECFSDFRDTEYFKRWDELLNSKEFSEMLRQTGKKAVFYMHRNMQRFANQFTETQPDIHIQSFPDDAHELLKHAALLITDYSSVAMDFAYMEKPVIYYQFDYDRFRKNHLAEGYYSYEKDGFGNITNDLRGVIDETGYIISNGMKPMPVHTERMKRFFNMKDRDNCRSTYMAVKELSESQ